MHESKPSKGITLAGVGLHSGAPSKTVLSLCDGPSTLSQAGICCTLDELQVARSDHGVQVRDATGRLSIDLVEHLFAALAAFNALRGVRIDVMGPELPLLDGGALRWTLALDELGLEQRPPRFRVAQSASYGFGDTCYRLTPSSGTRLEVAVEFAIPLGRQRASFSGDMPQFRDRLAPARTFGFARDRSALAANGRAACIGAGDLLVFNDDGTLAIPARAPLANELAAHKLLDLMGDSLLYGALPQGTISAIRPGHTANHAMFARALKDGILVPLSQTQPHTRIACPRAS